MADQLKKVLILHNRYRNSGGEERYVQSQYELLTERGHQVELYNLDSGDLTGTLGKLRAARSLVSGGMKPAAIGELVNTGGYDVAHFHNIHPLFGPRAVAAAKSAGATTVMHLHNYRIFCAVGVAYRDGKLCEDCHGRNTLPGLRNNCRRSRPESFSYATGLSLHQQRLLKAVDSFITPSEAAADQLANFGLPRNRITVVPHFVEPTTDNLKQSNSGYAIYCGRLSEEKGVETAVAAAALAKVPLKVVGDGPQRHELETLNARLAGQAVFTGRVERAQLNELVSNASALLLPSRCNETGGYAALEAMAVGVPVLASSLGALPEIVGNGDQCIDPQLVEPWAEKLKELLNDRDLAQRLGAAGKERIAQLFTPDRHYKLLLETYAQSGLTQA